jgi:hypothetical protein
MKKVFLVINSDGMVIKACSTVFKAFRFVRENNFRYDHRELSHIVKMEIDGETWGAHISFEEMEGA